MKLKKPSGTMSMRDSEKLISYKIFQQQQKYSPKQKKEDEGEKEIE